MADEAKALKFLFSKNLPVCIFLYKNAKYEAKNLHYGEIKEQN